MGIEQVLSGIFKPTPGPTPARTAKAGAAPGQPRDAAKVANGAATLAALKDGGDFAAVTPQQWQALGTYLAGLNQKQQDTLVQALRRDGIALVIQPDVKEVSLLSDRGNVTVDTAAHEARVTLGENNTRLYRGGKLEETITPKGNKLVVTRDGKTQVWDPNTGKGTQANGKPLPPHWADPVPGEAPRKPWARPQPNKLVEPDGDDNDPNYWKLYNHAVEKTGGSVVESMSLATEDARRYNCHSFATTQGHGDLHDPFDAADQPRWVNFPTYQLTNGPFKQLKPDQRVHVGDVIMYADDKGVPTHTGVVRAVDSDGNPTQVESKWGAYGRYLHGPFDVPSIYGGIAAFYRPDPTKDK